MGMCAWGLAPQPGAEPKTQSLYLQCLKNTAQPRKKPTCLSCPAEALISGQEESPPGGTEVAPQGMVGYRDVWIESVS